MFEKNDKVRVQPHTEGWMGGEDPRPYEGQEGVVIDEVDGAGRYYVSIGGKTVCLWSADLVKI